MTDLTPTPALGAAQPQRLTCGALSLTENAGLALASLALRAGQAPPAALDLPGPGAWAAQQPLAPGGIAAFWTGPGQWMLTGDGLAATDFAARVRGLAPGASVTEQTDGWAVFDIASAAGAAPAEALMARLVNIDPGRFAAGSATRTGMDHLSVFVLRPAADRLAVLAPRSAAGSVWHRLTTAAARLAAAAPPGGA